MIKVLDGTDQFPPDYVLTILFLYLDTSEFTSIRHDEVSAIEDPAHIQKDRYHWQHTFKKREVETNSRRSARNLQGPQEPRRIRE